MPVGLPVLLLLMQAPAAAAGASPPPAAVSASAPAYTFSSGAGLLLFYVHPDRAEDFEAVLARLEAVLDADPDPVRRKQAAGWRVFKADAPVRDATLYLFMFDPAVPEADYDPIKLLGDAVPAEVQALYDRLRQDVIRVERLGLTKLR